LLTAEETRLWIEDAGLCLFAPRRAHFAAPAPSLAEAVMGAVTDAPTRETVETATALMKQLAADSTVIPLNLFGGAGSPGAGFGAAAVAGGTGLGSFDTQDFVMAREVLPYVFSLIGGRNWKSGPGDKASPLMAEVWTKLRDEGAMTAAEIQRALGREVTETAVLRALGELWHGLRVIPAYDAEVTRWEVTQARFAAEMTASQKVAQTTALSALVSLYLDGVVAAEREEIETFLSPLAARSRVREVVNGMQATRQLEIASVGAHPLLHVLGSLPEFTIEEVTEPEAEEETAAGGEARPRPRFEKRERKTFERKPFDRKPSERGERAGGFPRREREERKPFRESREERGERRPFEKKRFEKKPFEKRERKTFERKPFDRKPSERGERFAARGESGEERRPFEKKRFEKKPFERKTFGKKKLEGERGGFEKRRFGGQERSFERRPFGKRREEGEGERKPFRESRGERGERRPFEKKPFERKPFGKKRFEGEREGFKKKPFGKKPGGFKKREEGESGTRFAPKRREFGGERKPRFGEAKRDGKAGFKPRRTFDSRDEKTGFKGRQEKPGFRKPGKPFGKQDGPFTKGKPGFKKTGKNFGKPAFRKDKPAFGKRPGGFAPPRRKRREEGSGDGE